MAITDLSDYKNLYIESVRKSVSSLHEQCNKLANNSLDKEAVRNLHIASHSLRSRSQVMGYADIASLSEAIERKSDDILRGVGKVDDEFIANLNNFIDRLNLELIKL